MTRTENNRRVADTFSDTRKESQNCFYFLGELYQSAIDAAADLGIAIGNIGDDISYVRSKEEFEKIKAYIVEYKLNGYWEYI